MKIFGKTFFESQQPIHVPTIEKVDANTTIVNSFAFASDNSFLPSQTNFFNSASYVRFGDDNLFTNRLSDLYLSSPLHKNAIDLKTKLIAGNGYELKSNTKTFETEFFLTNNNPTSPANELIYSLAKDLKLYGNFYLKITWNVNFTKIIKVERLPAFGVRLGALDNSYKPTKVFYSFDWLNARSYQTYSIFNPENKTDIEQIMIGYSNSVDSRIYNFPDYTAGLNSIAAGAAISVYQLNIVENSFSPGVAIKFYKKPNSPEEKRLIVDGIKKQYQGKHNAGKVMIFFSDGKDLAPDVTPIDVSNLDKQFTVLESSIENNIIFAHQIISPLLLGVKTAGQLGSTSELETSYMILEKTQMSFDRKLIENKFNQILTINGYDNLTIKPFVVFEEQAKVEASQPTKQLIK